MSSLSYNKQKGSGFETLGAQGFAKHLDDDRIERRTKNGVKDRGDLNGIKYRGLRVVVECKNEKAMSIGTWIKEAEIERGNDDAGIAVVMHKRRGHTDFLDQYFTMTGRDLIALMTGVRPD